MSCDLCDAKPITPRLHEDDLCWIADCRFCRVPMVVWRAHQRTPPAAVRAHMHERLAAVTPFDHYVDDRMRKIPDHYHAHARRKPAAWSGLKTTVWLDYDGVIKTGHNGGGPLISADLMQQLAALAVDIEWLSMRGHAAKALGITAGLPTTWSVAAVPSDYPPQSWLARDASWWKLAALQRRSSASRPFVWVDDHLRLAPVAYQWAQHCGAPHLLLAPDPNVGLTAEQLDEIATFVDSHR